MDLWLHSKDQLHKPLSRAAAESPALRGEEKNGHFEMLGNGNIPVLLAAGLLCSVTGYGQCGWAAMLIAVWVHTYAWAFEGRYLAQPCFCMVLCEGTEQEALKSLLLGLKGGMKPATAPLQPVALFWVCRRFKNRNNCPKSGAVVWDLRINLWPMFSLFSAQCSWERASVLAAAVNWGVGSN